MAIFTKENLCIDDIGYIPDSGILEIRKQSENSLDQSSYILDVSLIVSIIHMCYKGFKKTGREYESKVKRATVNPVG